jgi:hypothetical protein
MKKKKEYVNNPREAVSVAMQKKLGVAFPSEIRRKKIARDEFWQAVVIFTILGLLVFLSGFAN